MNNLTQSQKDAKQAVLDRQMNENGWTLQTSGFSRAESSDRAYRFISAYNKVRKWKNLLAQVPRETWTIKRATIVKSKVLGGNLGGNEKRGVLKHL